MGTFDGRVVLIVKASMKATEFSEARAFYSMYTELKSRTLEEPKIIAHHSITSHLFRVTLDCYDLLHYYLFIIFLLFYCNMSIAIKNYRLFSSAAMRLLKVNPIDLDRQM